MRIFPVLLFLLALSLSAFAQEPQRAAQNDTEAEARAFAEAHRLLDQLLSQDAEVKRNAKAGLRMLDHATLQKLLEEVQAKLDKVQKEMAAKRGTLLAYTLPLGRLSPTVVTEIMTGTFQDQDGTTRAWTLRSLGKNDRYELRATTRDQQGELKRIEEQGTMAELQKKYPFLKEKKAFSQVRFGFAPGQDNPFRLGGQIGMLLEHSRAGTKDRRIRRLGASVRRPSEELAFHLRLSTGSGFVVTKIQEDGLAEKLGLRPFDVIVKIDGTLVDHSKQLKTLGRRKAKGVRTIEISRRANPVTIDVAKALEEEGR